MHTDIVAALTVLVTVTFGVFALAGIVAFGPRSYALGEAADFSEREPQSKKRAVMQCIAIVLQMSAALAVIWLVTKYAIGVSVYGAVTGCSAVFLSAQALRVATHPLDDRSPRLAAVARYGIAGAFVVPAYFFTSWLATDIAAVAMAVGILVAMRSMGLKFCLVLLVGIMVYDAIAVFGTKMMLDVAGQVTKPGRELPILFTLPASFGLDAPRAAILGLGDVVLPGIIVMIGFRESRYFGYRSLAIGPLVGYCLGLLATGAVLLITKAGQPATIYLVPGAVAGLLIPAWVTGTLKELFLPPPPEGAESEVEAESS